MSDSIGFGVTAPSLMDLPVEPGVAAVLPQLMADLGSDYIDAYRKVLGVILVEMRRKR
jgi:hypothetical protein